MNIQKTQEALLNDYPLVSQFLPGILGLAKKLSFRYKQEHNEEDFQQVAVATACRYESRYVDQGATFYSYVTKPIETAIQDEFGNPHSKTKVYKLVLKSINEYIEKYGEYPDIASIQAWSKLSYIDILSVYFDREREISLTDMVEEEHTSYAWVTDHLAVLTSLEQQLVDLVFFQDLTPRQAAVSLGIHISKINNMMDVAINKLKQSIGDYE